MDDNYYNHDVLTEEHTYLSDLSDGTLKIWDVPQEHRTNIAYMQTCKYAIRMNNKRTIEESFLEKKLIENLLLDDIISSSLRKDAETTEELKVCYKRYFSPSLGAEIPIMYNEDIIPLL